MFCSGKYTFLIDWLTREENAGEESTLKGAGKEDAYKKVTVSVKKERVDNMV